MKRPPHFLRPITAFTLTAVALAACGSDEAATTSQDQIPKVVATTSIWGDITANVACDGLAEVETIIPLGGDPHSFEASLRDRETMEGAVLIVANGLSLEESLADTLDAVEAGGVVVINAADGIDTIPIGASGIENDSHDDDHDDDHSGDDPHVWLDPTRVIATLPTIANALAETGIDEGALEVCVADYTDKLQALDEEIETILATVDETDRLLVTNHDSLGYFADRYDFTVVGSVIPSPSTLAETNPAELEELAELIESTQVGAIFAETQHSSSDAQALAARVGDIEVITLRTATLDASGTAGETYVGWLLENARLIAEGLQ